MVAVQISAVQSVPLFGRWNQPILTLPWNDVKYHHFTWRPLRSLGLGAEMLKKISKSGCREGAFR